jgi:hypothetical protein
MFKNKQGVQRVKRENNLGCLAAEISGHYSLQLLLL